METKKLSPKFIATMVIPAMIASGELVVPTSVFAETASQRTGTETIESLIQSKGAYAYEDETGHRIIYITAEDIHDLASMLDKIQDSIALNYRNTTAYKAGDYCYYAGKIYKCTKDSTGNDPTNKNYWQETTVTKELTTVEHDIDSLRETLTQEVADALKNLGSNFAGIYDTNVSVSYQPGQLVMYDNVLYKCVSATSSGSTTPNQSGAWQKTTVAEQISIISNSVAAGSYTLATTIAAKNGTDLRGKFSKDSSGNYTSSATLDEINKAISTIPSQVTVNNVKNGNISLTYHYHVNNDAGNTANANDPYRKTTDTSTTYGGCYKTPHYYYRYTRTIPSYTFFTGYAPVVSATSVAVYHEGYEYHTGGCGQIYSAWGYHEYYSGHYYDTDYSSCWSSQSIYVAGYTSYIEYYFVSGYTPVYQTKEAYTEVGYGNGYSVPSNSQTYVAYPTGENSTGYATASVVYTTDQVLYELSCGKQDGQILHATITY